MDYPTAVREVPPARRHHHPERSAPPLPNPASRCTPPSRPRPIGSRPAYARVPRLKAPQIPRVSPRHDGGSAGARPGLRPRGPALLDAMKAWGVREEVLDRGELIVKRDDAAKSARDFGTPALSDSRFAVPNVPSVAGSRRRRRQILNFPRRRFFTGTALHISPRKTRHAQSGAAVLVEGQFECCAHPGRLEEIVAPFGTGLTTSRPRCCSATRARDPARTTRTIPDGATFAPVSASASPGPR